MEFVKERKTTILLTAANLYRAVMEHFQQHDRATPPGDKELLLKTSISLTLFRLTGLHFRLVYAFGGLLKVIRYIRALKRSTNSELKWVFENMTAFCPKSNLSSIQLSHSSKDSTLEGFQRLDQSPAPASQNNI